MNKKNIIYSIAWFIDFTVLLFIILFPKNENMFNNLYVVFLCCVFIVPLCLLIFQIYDNMRSEKEINEVKYFIPSVGSSLIMSLTFVRFMSSIKKEYVSQMVFILVAFLMAEILLGYVLFDYNKNTKKTVVGAICIYFLLVIFFFAAMIMSYDHSIIW